MQSIPANSWRLCLRIFKFVWRFVFAGWRGRCPREMACCSICYEEWPPTATPPPGIRCDPSATATSCSRHFVCSPCLGQLAQHELDFVRLAKTFGALGCPDPGCTGPEGGRPYADEALCEALGGNEDEAWRGFVAARDRLPVRLAAEQPDTAALVAEASPLTAVAPWLRYLEVSVGPVGAEPLRLWASRGLGGGSTAGLGVQLWPAAITLAERAAACGASHRRVCDLGCGVGLVGLAWLHAAAAAATVTGGSEERRRLALTDGDEEW